MSSQNHYTSNEKKKKTTKNTNYTKQNMCVHIVNDNKTQLKQYKYVFRHFKSLAKNNYNY